MFQLIKQEVRKIAAAIRDHKFKMMHTLPYAFTKHGAFQAANVLNSPRAVEMCIYVVRAFIAMRQMTVDFKEPAHKVAEPDKKYGRHDEIIYPVRPRREIAPDDPGDCVRPQITVVKRVKFTSVGLAVIANVHACFSFCRILAPRQRVISILSCVRVRASLT